MSKFKIGDRVKRIDCGVFGVRVGDINTVTAVGLGNKWLDLEGYERSHDKFRFIAEKFELVGKEMNRQEALVEIIKGNTVLTYSGSEVYAENLDIDAPEFFFKGFNGTIDPLRGALNNDNGPFTLKPKEKPKKVTKVITLDGKDIEISEESFQAFKEQFLGE